MDTKYLVNNKRCAKLIDLYEDLPNCSDLHTYFRWNAIKNLVEPNKITLDLGCGDGEITLAISKKIKSIVGVDINAYSIRGLQKRVKLNNIRNAKFRMSDCRNLQFKDNSFEQVVVNDLLEHVVEDHAVLSEIERVLVDNGALILNVPLPSYSDLFPQDWIVKIGHIRDGYTLEDISKILYPCFDIEDYVYHTRCAEEIKRFYCRGEKDISTLLNSALTKEQDNILPPHGLCIRARYRKKRYYTVDIAIVTMNRKQKLEQTIDSILQHSNSNNYKYNILIANNGSADDTMKYLDKISRQISNLKVIAFSENVGYVKAFNKLVQMSTANFIAKIDDDVIVNPNWLKNIISTFKKHPNAGIVGIKMLYPDKRYIFASEMKFWPLHGNHRHLDDGRFNYIKHATAVPGTCCVIKKRVFLKTGLYDERYYPSQMDDVDHCASTISAGLNIIYNGKISAIHKYDGKPASRINKNIFYKKWGIERLSLMDKVTGTHKYPAIFYLFFSTRGFAMEFDKRMDRFRQFLIIYKYKIIQRFPVLKRLIPVKKYIKQHILSLRGID